MISSPNIEQVLLGAMIVDPVCTPDVMATIANNDPFADPTHQLIFDTLRTMYRRGEAIDLYTLSQQQGIKEHIRYIVELSQKIDSGVHSPDYARLVCEQHMRRRLESIGTELSAKAAASPELDTLLSWTQRSLDDTLGVITSSNAPRPINDVLQETMQVIEQRAKSNENGELTGVLTGLRSLDEATGGWRGGQLIVLAGRPAMGKSAVMLHFAREAASCGTPTVIFSLEMLGRELGDRLLLRDAKVSSDDYRAGRLTNDDWRNIERSNTLLSRLPLSIADSSSVTMLKIKAQCQQLKARGRCGMVVIDYLQLLDTRTESRTANREREIAETTRQAKVMATELDIPVILLSQLSRKVEERADKTPLLSDLRESGAIEQDADIVLFVNRPAMYNIPTIDTRAHGTISTEGLGVLNIAKQRNGRTGNCYFRHSPDLNSIAEY